MFIGHCDTTYNDFTYNDKEGERERSKDKEGERESSKDKEVERL